MRWRGGRQSANVEDRRGLGRGKMLAGGGLGTLILIVIAMFLGLDPMPLLQGPGPAAPPQNPKIQGAPTDELAQFVSVVLADTEDVWNKLFREKGREYQEPRLVLFSDAVQSACGMAQSAVGPFYCPPDQRVYIDLSFYQDLRSRHGAPGDFAQAYVIAHEIGHHVQNLLGISGQVQSRQRRASETESNALSVRLELQADFLAGVWAHHAHKMRNMLESGDIEEAMTAAAAIGDDRLQRQSRGYVQPETFTHGSSQQRVYWFRKGFESGDMSQGDTFNDPNL